MVGYRFERGSSREPMLQIGASDALRESKLAEDMLGNPVRSLGDGRPIAPARAKLDAPGDELLSHTVARRRFGDPKEEKVQRIAWAPRAVTPVFLV